MKHISRYTFDYAFRALILLLPFLTVLSIFFRERLGIPGVSFLKEILLISMVLTLGYSHIRGTTKILWTKYDLFIGGYILVLLCVSFFTTGIQGILYGGRYDFAFLLAFFILFHGYPLLERPLSYYLKLFLLSGGAMLCISMLLKWPLSEDLLLYLGYSGNPSNWQFGSSLPIFHGVDGATVRRFQGLLDGPNTMGAYLLVYMGIALYYLKSKKEWFFLIGCGLAVLGILIFYTYSRSAVLGLFAGVGLIILFLLPVIYRKYRIQFISIVSIFMLLIVGIFIQYAGNIGALIGRGGSTSGHMERMKMGIERFIEHPLGQGLGSAGPAYRYIQNLENKQRKEIEEIDRYYIPESWYIQQLVEGGVLGFLLYMGIMILLGIGLFRVHIFLAGMFLSVCVMNLFLHTFESSIVSLSLFLLIGLFLAYYHHHHEKG